jgi:hypothetical protein
MQSVTFKSSSRSISVTETKPSGASSISNLEKSTRIPVQSSLPFKQTKINKIQHQRKDSASDDDGTGSTATTADGDYDMDAERNLQVDNDATKLHTKNPASSRATYSKRHTATSSRQTSSSDPITAATTLATGAPTSRINQTPQTNQVHPAQSIQIQEQPTFRPRSRHTTEHTSSNNTVPTPPHFRNLTNATTISSPLSTNNFNPPRRLWPPTTSQSTNHSINTTNMNINTRNQLISQYANHTNVNENDENLGPAEWPSLAVLNYDEISKIQSVKPSLSAIIAESLLIAEMDMRNTKDMTVADIDYNEMYEGIRGGTGNARGVGAADMDMLGGGGGVPDVDMF